MVTSRRSGKIKRIRHTRRVLLAPCDLMGNVLGQQIEAIAHELPDAQHADALLARKYGAAYEVDSSCRRCCRSANTAGVRSAQRGRRWGRAGD